MKKLSVKKGAACMACLGACRPAPGPFTKNSIRTNPAFRSWKKRRAKAHDLHPVRQVRQGL